jgi:hypothetical protein
MSKPESQHWYNVAPDGTVSSRYDAGLKEARKELLFPSVTTIEKSIRANPTLARWITAEVVKACVEYPKMDTEKIDDYIARIGTASGKIAGTAADFGTRLHDAIENYPSIPVDQEIRPFYDAFTPWIDENIETIICSEEMVAHRGIGVAGKLDMIAHHKRHGRVVVDFKSQGIKAKANFYDSWPRQLAFYEKAKVLDPDVFVSDTRILSVVINSVAPSAPIEKLWTKEEQLQGWQEFICHAWLFFSEKNYWPIGEWSLAEMLRDSISPEWP